LVTGLALIEQVFDTGRVGLIQSVPDDEIAAEFAAAWPDDDGAGPPVRVPVPVAGMANRGPVGRRRAGDPRDLTEAAERVRPVSLATDQRLPVLPALENLLPDGLGRGTTVMVGAMSLALALAAAPTAAGSWVACVGLPGLGLVSAAEAGVALERFAVVSAPPPDVWGTVVAALIGAFDIVLLGPAPRVGLAETRRLAARARERGAVLVQVDSVAGRGAGEASRSVSGLGFDLRFAVVESQWHGLGAGHGHLRARRLRVEVTGRRQATRPRRADLWFFDADGRITAAGPGEHSASCEVFAGSDADRMAEAHENALAHRAGVPVTVEPDALPVWSDAG
jgi:hypothetical protein